MREGKTPNPRCRRRGRAARPQGGDHLRPVAARTLDRHAADPLRPSKYAAQRRQAGQRKSGRPPAPATQLAVPSWPSVRSQGNLPTSVAVSSPETPRRRRCAAAPGRRPAPRRAAVSRTLPLCRFALGRGASASRQRSGNARGGGLQVAHARAAAGAARGSDHPLDHLHVMGAPERRHSSISMSTCTGPGGRRFSGSS